MTIIAIDGDQVGKRLEQSMLENDLTTLVALSASITSYFEQIAAILADAGLQVLVQGGDIVMASGNVTIELVSHVLALRGPVNVSVGIGSSILTAHLALRASKGRGGRCAIEATGIHSDPPSFRNYMSPD